MGPISLKRLSLVHPVLAEKIKQLEKNLGWPLGVTQGLRTSEEQLALWSQGRATLVLVNVLRAKVGWAPITEAVNQARVTNAKPGESYHEYGLAIDVVPVSLDTGAPDWNEAHSVWRDLVSTGEALGLTSGISWKDEPHFQLQGIWPLGAPPEEAKNLLASGGLQAVWNASGIREETTGTIA